MQVALFIVLLLYVLVDILSNNKYSTIDFYDTLSQNDLVDQLGRKTYKRFIWIVWFLIILFMTLLVVIFMLWSQSFPNIYPQLQRIFSSLLVLYVIVFIVEIPMIHLAINMKPQMTAFRVLKWIDLILCILGDCLLLTALAFILNAWIKGCA